MQIFTRKDLVEAPTLSRIDIEGDEREFTIFSTTSGEEIEAIHGREFVSERVRQSKIAAWKQRRADCLLNRHSAHNNSKNKNMKENLCSQRR